VRSANGEKLYVSRKLYRIAVAFMAVAVLIGGISQADAKPAATSNWHLGVYNSSGRALSNAQTANGAGLATFHFTTTADVALLTTSQGSQKGNVIGDITGKKVTATFTITGTNDFIYYGQPCGNTPPSARLYFENSTGGFAYTNYWWSNPASAVLANGTLTVTATVSPEQWSDWNGQYGTTEAAGFAAAASNAKEIGLSFGGGCFFENGVGASNADLTLDSFTVA
jgi:hypothetical protein